VQWCIAKNGGVYTQWGVAKGLKVPCLFMITEVSIRCQKTPEVGIRRIPPNTPLIMCKHDVINIQHAYCCLVGPSARSSSEHPLPAVGIPTRQAQG